MLIIFFFFWKPSKLFQSIETTPLGAASLAQVHKATLIDGTTVAVKVQHPLVKRYSEVDMKAMEVRIKEILNMVTIWDNF